MKNQRQNIGQGTRERVPHPRDDQTTQATQQRETNFMCQLRQAKLTSIGFNQ